MMPLLEEPYALYCEEHTFDEDLPPNDNAHVDDSENNDSSVIKDSPLLCFPFPEEEDELESLILKESETQLLCYDSLMSYGALAESRRKAIDWVLRVNAYYGFSAFTAVLAVNYLDRFLLSIRVQKNKPWTTQLTAVACLSLAAKVQETHVPLLLDLQVEESKYVFEAKTIQRMELLVLSTLEWRMNPVNPVAFFHLISRKLPPESIMRRDFLLSCESLLLALTADVRLGSYFPSVIASAIMLCVVKEAEPSSDVSEYRELIMNVVEKTDEGKVKECYVLIQETSCGRGSSLDPKPLNGHKRKILSVPSSPVGVGDASFSCDSSNESWAVESSPLSSYNKYSFKRRRILH